MIKRRYYKIDHGDGDEPSGSSSSSSDSELEAEEATDGSDDENEEEANVEVMKKDECGSSPSGYESDDSSAHEVNLDSSGFLTSDEDGVSERDGESLAKSHLPVQANTDPVGTEEEKDKDRLDLPECVVRQKSVFKCRLCPRIVCLSEETLNAHLKSKRHARSEKLLKEGRLKLVLDKDGKLDEETAPTVAPEENSSPAQRKKRGWRGQKKGKKRERPSFSDARDLAKSSAKKRHEGN